MTAYGRGEHCFEDTVFIVEIRSVNHRYMDIVLRMPKSLLALEKDIKAQISSRIRRGRVEVSIEMQSRGENIPYDLELNAPLAKSYFNIFTQLAESVGLDQEIRLESLAQMKDVITAKPAEMDLAQVQQGIEEALDQALNPLDEMRRREGKAIEADFLERIRLLERYLDEVEKQAPELVQTYRKRLKDNVNRMLEDVSLDESRLAQEIAVFAEKSDITEEIVRFKSHLAQFRKYMAADDIVGRRLDFLIQEINREVNTIGSKTPDSQVSMMVVEMKAELEKLREQVQNVE